jgi:hypothetical protein
VCEVWHKSIDNVDRFWYNNNGTSFFHSGNVATAFVFRNFAQSDIFSINNNGEASCTGSFFAGGLRVNGGDYGNTIYQGSTTVGANIGLTLRNANSFIFNSLTGSSYIPICRMNTNGFYIFENLIQNYLFNNTGLPHATTTDFNAISQYGFRYIYSPASNSPDSSFTGWYTWYMGLGKEYNNNYGAQIAFARNTSLPRMYIRYKENSSWGSWYHLRAYIADIANTLASGNQTINGNLTINGSCSPYMLAVQNSGNEYLCAQIGQASQGGNYQYPICIAVGTFIYRIPPLLY